MTKFKPFFIGSTICLKEDNISTINNFISMVGNIGNSYITYSLIKSLCGGLVDIKHIPNIYNYDFSEQDKDIDIINNECSHVFLILQDQIRVKESYNCELPYKNLMNFCHKLNKPIIIAGLGANSFEGYDSKFHEKLEPELINFLKFISEKSNLIGVRGFFTEEVLKNIGINNIQVIGCPSFYEMGPNRFINKKEYSPELKILYSSQLPYDQSVYPERKIILQDEKKLIDILAFQNRDYKSLTQNQKLCLLQEQFMAFSGIENWKNFVSEFDFTLGYRLHGSILSINSGACSVVMNGDSRAKEMSEFLKIPYHPELAGETNTEKIYSMCNYDKLNSQYPKLYEDYISFLNKNGLEIFKQENENQYEYISQPELSIKYPYDKEILVSFMAQSNSDMSSLEEKMKIDMKSLEKTFKVDKIPFIQQIFSLQNNKDHKVLRILGFKIKFKK